MIIAIVLSPQLTTKAESKHYGPVTLGARLWGLLFANAEYLVKPLYDTVDLIKGTFEASIWGMPDQPKKERTIVGLFGSAVSAAAFLGLAALGSHYLHYTAFTTAVFAFMGALAIKRIFEQLAGRFIPSAWLFAGGMRVAYGSALLWVPLVVWKTLHLTSFASLIGIIQSSSTNVALATLLSVLTNPVFLTSIISIPLAFYMLKKTLYLNSLLKAHDKAKGPRAWTTFSAGATTKAPTLIQAALSRRLALIVGLGWIISGFFVWSNFWLPTWAMIIFFSWFVGFYVTWFSGKPLLMFDLEHGIKGLYRTYKDMEKDDDKLYDNMILDVADRIDFKGIPYTTKEFEGEKYGTTAKSVIELMKKGHSKEQIASIFGVTVKTIEDALSHSLLRKVEAEARANRFFRNGALAGFIPAAILMVFGAWHSIGVVNMVLILSGLGLFFKGLIQAADKPQKRAAGVATLIIGLSLIAMGVVAIYTQWPGAFALVRSGEMSSQGLWMLSLGFAAVPLTGFFFASVWTIPGWYYDNKSFVVNELNELKKDVKNIIDKVKKVNFKKLLESSLIVSLRSKAIRLIARARRYVRRMRRKPPAKVSFFQALLDKDNPEARPYYDDKMYTWNGRQYPRTDSGIQKLKEEAMSKKEEILVPIKMLVGGRERTFWMDRGFKKAGLEHLQSNIMYAVGESKDVRGDDPRRLDPFAGIMNDNIVVLLLDRSQSYCEDHQPNGFIGFNRILFDKGPKDKGETWADKEAREIIFMVALSHELRHETGIGEDYERLLTREDVLLSLEIAKAHHKVTAIKPLVLIASVVSYLAPFVKDAPYSYITALAQYILGISFYPEEPSSLKALLDIAENNKEDINKRRIAISILAMYRYPPALEYIIEKFSDRATSFSLDGPEGFLILDMVRATGIFGAAAAPALEMLKSILAKRTPAKYSANSYDSDTGISTITKDFYDNEIKPELEKAINKIEDDIKRGPKPQGPQLNEELAKKMIQTGQISIDDVTDYRLRDFLLFLQRNGLEDIIVIGGAPRDILFGQRLNDLDISVAIDLAKVNLTEDERAKLSDPREPVPHAIYAYAMERLKALVRAMQDEKIEVDLEDLLTHAGEAAHFEDFGNLRIQYGGPVIYAPADEGKEERYVKRFFADTEKRQGFYSHNGASLLRLGIDCRGRVYGDLQAIKDAMDKKTAVTAYNGRIDKFRLGDILRLLRLKHQFGLAISPDDNELIKRTIARYRMPEGEAGKLVIHDDTIDEIDEYKDRIVMTAINKEAALAELKELGIIDLINAAKARLVVDPDLSDLSPSVGKYYHRSQYVIGDRRYNMDQQSIDAL
ncbi:MAG: hypothetical protein NC933_04765, partial [Candidatus Omnitrophica bacterium]|nr:hypothetical protein [Candidatus Omnitrophota bacterium]